MLAPWKDRVVRLEDVDPSVLLANPMNHRMHPAEQQAAMGDVLQDLGWIDRVTVSERTGLVLNGHMRVKEAIRTGQATVPCRYVDVSVEEERIILAMFDRIGAMATVDAVKLGQVLAKVNTRSAEVAAMLQAQARKHSAPVATVVAAPTLHQTSEGRGRAPNPRVFGRVTVGFVRMRYDKGKFDEWFATVQRDLPDKDALAAEFWRRFGFRNKP